jgi:dihydrofolate reductase
MIVSLAVAMAYDGAIGKDGRLPWTPDDVPGELSLFRKTTTGKPVIMGRKTWDSLPPAMRPLRGRAHVVISRDHEVRLGVAVAHMADAVKVVPSLEDALAVAERLGAAEAIVIGGAQVFEAAYRRADRAYLTLVEGRYEADTYFPRAILSDHNWAWGPDPVKGKGWTRFLLFRVPESATRIASHTEQAPISLREGA